MTKIHKMPNNNNDKNTKYQTITMTKMHKIPNNNNDQNTNKYETITMTKIQNTKQEQ
jgi:hypothetical protein